MHFVGRVTVAVNGNELNSKPGAKFRYGGVERTEVETDQGSGFAEKYVSPMVECDMLASADTDLAEISGWNNVTVTFTPDVGPAYVMAKAWLENVPELTAGDGGSIPLTFKARKAEKAGGN